jgi:diamine N-acetyltransferase
MSSLEGKDIKLRALEPSDLDFLYELENDESVWEVSNTTTPYSKFVLKKYLDNAHRDIYEVKQLRLVICEKKTHRPIGFVDLFDFDPKHKKVGVGIVIFKAEDKGKGYATQSLQQVCAYAFGQLNMHQVYANITEDNTSSLQLFEKLGFTRSGVKKDWIHSEGIYKSEYLYQLIVHD